jgi:two-component system sensor histidine kinase UhpB
MREREGSTSRCGARGLATDAGPGARVVREDEAGRPTRRLGMEEALIASREALQQSYANVRALAGRLITAQEEERRRIALELHDAMGQRIAATCIALRRLQRRLHGDAEAGAQLEAVLLVLTELAEGVRRLSHDMHPPILRLAGLEAALRGHCHELRTLARLEVELAANGLPPMAPDAELCLFRVAQEALGNVVAHSGVHRAALSVTCCGGVVELEVRDAGNGFDPARTEYGLGLAGMDERARLLGGTFALRSRPGEGTAVRVRLPLHPRPPDA